jgi:hypothetical protein
MLQKNKHNLYITCWKKIFFTLQPKFFIRHSRVSVAPCSGRLCDGDIYTFESIEWPQHSHPSQCFAPRVHIVRLFHDVSLLCPQWLTARGHDAACSEPVIEMKGAGGKSEGSFEKIKQEVLGRTNRLLSLIRHRRVQQFFYSCCRIRYCGNVSTEPLPSNDTGIFTETNRYLTTIGGYTYRHTNWWEGSFN